MKSDTPGVGANTVSSVDTAGSLVLPVSGTTTFGVPIKGTTAQPLSTATTTAPT